MKVSKQTIVRAVFASTIILGLAVYLINPSGTATYDPRARIFGHTLMRATAGSMVPTVRSGDYLLIKTFAYASSSPQRGDIIAFRFPPNPKQTYLKRVVGIGGDSITIKNHQVILNGDPLTEDFTEHTYRRAPRPEQRWQVPQGYLFVLGDNRDNSADSRLWGFVSESAVVGKVQSVIYSESKTKAR